MGREAIGDNGGGADAPAMVTVQWDRGGGLRVMTNAPNPVVIFMLQAALHLKDMETVGTPQVGTGGIMRARAPPFSGRQIDRS